MICGEPNTDYLHMFTAQFLKIMNDTSQKMKCFLSKQIIFVDIWDQYLSRHSGIMIRGMD